MMDGGGKPETARMDQDITGGGKHRTDARWTRLQRVISAIR